MITRRSFLSALLAGVGGIALGRVPTLPARAEELVDLDWMRAARREGESHFLVEARFRVNGGPWITKAARERKPFLWLTPRVGYGFKFAEQATGPITVIDDLGWNELPGFGAFSQNINA